MTIAELKALIANMPDDGQVFIFDHGVDGGVHPTSSDTWGFAHAEKDETYISPNGRFYTSFIVLEARNWKSEE